MRACAECGGDGWVEYPSHFSQGRTDGSIIYRREECGECGGSGELEEECGEDCSCSACLDAVLAEELETEDAGSGLCCVQCAAGTSRDD